MSEICWIYEFNECPIACKEQRGDIEFDSNGPCQGHETTSFYSYSSEYFATLAAVMQEFEAMSARYYLARKYEEPSPYYKCVARLHKVDWLNEQERNAWLKEHEEALAVYNLKVPFVIKSVYKVKPQREADLMKEFQYNFDDDE
jgi:hypothetical protein